GRGAVASYYLARALQSRHESTNSLSGFDDLGMKSLEDEAEKLFGPPRPSSAEPLLALAASFRKEGKLTDAEGAYRQAIFAHRQEASNDVALAISLDGLSQVLGLVKKWSDASAI